MQPIFNCFSGDTKFITDKGVKTFNSLYNNDKVKVLNKDGLWKEATVKKYGKGKLQKITLTSGTVQKQIRASYNHRWILKDGSITTNLSCGDRLMLLPTAEEVNIIPEMFCLGFILGDGSDYNTESSEGVGVRLCAGKVKYAHFFEESGYLKSSMNYNSNDIRYSKNGFAFKQRFLDNKVWKFLNYQQKYSLIQGYVCADGCYDRNMFFTSDERILEMLIEISAVAGYHILNVEKKVRDTNYKQNSVLYTISYRLKQVPQNNWIVKSIDREDLHVHDLWCVEELETKSFTLDGGIVTGNCCVINLKDMLDNGTVINGKMVETPKSFQVACTVATQIVAQVASNQYGLK